MNRYISSFIISSIFYLATIASLFYFINVDSYCNSEITARSVKKVNFSIITQAESPKPKPKTVPKPKPKKKKKVEKIPKPIQKPEPTPEPIIEAEPIVEEKVIEELVMQEIDEEIQEESIEESQEQEEIATQTKNETDNETLAKQNIFITDLINKINSNKSYPHMARRRCIEGIVDVTFTIKADGNVENIEITSGRSIFKRSAIAAIANSFPIEVDTSLFDFPEEFKIKISYVLK